MGNLYGEIDLTILGRLVRNHPSLIRKVQFKDGEHQLLNINVNERQKQSDKGHTHYIRASVKKEEIVQGENYYLADLKPSTFGANNAQQQQQPKPAKQETKEDEDFPF